MKIKLILSIIVFSILSNIAFSQCKCGKIKFFETAFSAGFYTASAILDNGEKITVGLDTSYDEEYSAVKQNTILALQAAYTANLTFCKNDVGNYSIGLEQEQFETIDLEKYKILTYEKFVEKLACGKIKFIIRTSDDFSTIRIVFDNNDYTYTRIDTSYDPPFHTREQNIIYAAFSAIASNKPFCRKNELSGVGFSRAEFIKHFNFE